MDIFVPPSLKSADASLSLAESLSILIDPSKRKAIADDIKAHHALNDTEAKKAEDARSLIKEHTSVLNETKASEQRINKATKDLETEKTNFKSEKDAEWAKVALAKGEAKDALEKAQMLHKQALDAQNKANQKEVDLNKAVDEHTINVKKLAQDKAALAEDYNELAKTKKEILNLDAQTKAKVEKLKQFNF